MFVLAFNVIGFAEGYFLHWAPMIAADYAAEKQLKIVFIGSREMEEEEIPSV
jgi:hypothetical protein